ncbi:hypothetical protein MTR67_038825 [Solanum verrucosum]|uniref:Uncharacterized protein n=1 Tax=Solanum verrucosum TaxID=315347 RepID=A0AAF0ZQ26_SOLVR|nr:hypothetical protein MTR67_038825 [Solanum verrucosum]
MQNGKVIAYASRQLQVPG